MNQKEKTTEIARIAKVILNLKKERNDTQTRLEKEIKEFRIENELLINSLIKSECAKAGIQTSIIHKIL